MRFVIGVGIPAVVSGAARVLGVRIAIDVRSGSQISDAYEALHFSSSFQSFARIPSIAVLGHNCLALLGLGAGAFLPWAPPFDEFRAQQPMFGSAYVRHTKL